VRNINKVNSYIKIALREAYYKKVTVTSEAQEEFHSSIKVTVASLGKSKEPLHNCNHLI
jgi:hypothetical protein